MRSDRWKFYSQKKRYINKCNWQVRYTRELKPSERSVYSTARMNFFLNNKKKNDLKASRRFLDETKTNGYYSILRGEDIDLENSVHVFCVPLFAVSGKEKGMRGGENGSDFVGSLLLKVKTSFGWSSTAGERKEVWPAFFSPFSHCQGRIGHGES